MALIPDPGNIEVLIPKHPKEESMGNRIVPFGKEMYIERSDFFDADGPEGNASVGKPPKGFKRLLPGGKVRLRYGYVIECEEIVRDPNTNEPVELICTYDERTANGVTPEGEKRVKGIIQWVEATSAVGCKIRDYDRLFRKEYPGSETGNFLDDLNPDSIKEIEGCYVEPSVAEGVGKVLLAATRQDDGGKVYTSSLHYQFERTGYFALDEDSTDEKLIFNKVVTLRDTWGAPASNAGGGRKRGTTSSGQKKSDQTPGEDATRIALKACRILSVDLHPNADSLFVCKVDCGDEDNEPRTVVAGLAGKFSLDNLINKQVVCLTNLKPARLVGIESTGMILASEDTDGKLLLLGVPEGVADGELLYFEGYEGKGEPDVMLKSKGAVKVWDRVKAQLVGTTAGEAVYLDSGGQPNRLMSSKGAVTALPGSKIQ